MKINIKTYISDLIDDELSDSDFEIFLDSIDKNPEATKLYSDYLQLSNLIKSKEGTNFNIADKVMYEINKDKATKGKLNKVIKFVPRFVPQIAVAASTFLAITLGVYFYTPNDLYIVQNSAKNLNQSKFSQSMQLVLDKRKLNKMDTVSAIDKLNLMPFLNTSDFEISKNDKLKSNDIYISPISQDSVFEEISSQE